MLIQKNPLTMVGTLARCWLFTYQTPTADAQALLPRGLEPVTHGDYAFWNIVVSRIDRMRPKGFPRMVGISYWHAAYRLYVRFHPRDGAPIEGLYFVRSDCDNWLMSLGGKLLTDFNFHMAPIRVEHAPDHTTIQIAAPDAPATAQVGAPATALPAHSAFGSLEEAAGFLKYKPFGIAVDDKGTANVVQISRVEADWRSRIMSWEGRWAFFDDKQVRPEICYEVAPIAYQWNRARLYRART